ncbi:hypothetical protein L9F63_003720 [Diploptera punctata]|uniref:Globin domain-containing protein n=1 Tax=Diploptera punctata TaxID=6984 RepID=A0AAD7ZKA7_DIPPU|nr:hypothetical protein L9F63_003720 [Diploptera punctata]
MFINKPDNNKYRNKKSKKKPQYSLIDLNRQLRQLNNLLTSSDVLYNDLKKLTNEEKKFINDSWLAFMNLHPTKIVKSFLRFLQENPEYKRFFESVNDIPLEVLQYDVRVPKHVTAVLLYLNSMVYCMEDPYAMFFLSLQVGMIHNNMDLTAEDINLFNKYLLKIFEDELDLSEEGISVWNKVLDIFMYVFYIGMEIK